MSNKLFESLQKMEIENYGLIYIGLMLLVVIGWTGGDIYNNLRLAYIGEQRYCEIIDCIHIPAESENVGGEIMIRRESYTMKFDCTNLNLSLSNNRYCNQSHVNLLVSEDLKALQIIKNENLLLSAVKNIKITSLLLLVVVVFCIAYILWRILPQELNKIKKPIKVEAFLVKKLNLVAVTDLLALTISFATTVTIFILFATLVLSFLFTIETGFKILNGWFFYGSVLIIAFSPYLSLKTYYLINSFGNNKQILKNILVSIVALKAIITTLSTLQEVFTERPKISTFKDILALIVDNF